jgi:hypothetical protein
LLDVSTTDTDGVDALSTELGVGWLTTELELSLLAVVGALSTGGRSLVATITTNTYRGKDGWIRRGSKKNYQSYPFRITDQRAPDRGNNGNFSLDFFPCFFLKINLVPEKLTSMLVICMNWRGLTAESMLKYTISLHDPRGNGMRAHEHRP